MLTAPRSTVKSTNGQAAEVAIRNHTQVISLRLAPHTEGLSGANTDGIQGACGRPGNIQGWRPHKEGE